MKHPEHAPARRRGAGRFVCNARLLTVGLLIAAALQMSSGAAAASEPDLLGPLAWTLEIETADSLKLDAATRKQLESLAERRIRDGQRLLSDERLAEPERKVQLEQFRRDSEVLGRQHLSLEQREQLTQMILARKGLTTLDRLDVRKVLGLDQKQLKQIDQFLEQRRQALRDASPIQHRVTAAKFERRLQSVLSETQLEKWERLAGLADAGATRQAAATDGGGQRNAEGGAGAKPGATLTFAFEGATWRTVLDWLAEKAKLSLFLHALPTGTLTYSDDRKYSPDEAIERINRFLIPNGYTLLRSGKMLSVIDLNDGRKAQFLEALAEYCELKDLDARGDHEVVRCVFAIAKADPNEVLTEVSNLAKLTPPVILPRSKQLIVIETAARQRAIRDVLQLMERPSLESGPVRRYQLEHVRAKLVIDALRPLVGIDGEGGNVGVEISLSSDPDGKQILATGSAAKLAIVEAVIEMMDKAPSPNRSDPLTLRAHSVKGGNLQAIDDVLQTLLVDENVRLAQEPKSGQLIAYGNAKVHQRIEETIAQLGGQAKVFETIQLKEVEPFVAVGIVREMFDIPYFADEDEDGDHPRVDYDTLSMQIFVRGTQEQVDEIKEVLTALEQPKQETSSGPLRLLPIQGPRAQALLETAKRFWTDERQLLVFPPVYEQESGVIEREIDSRPPGVPKKPTRPNRQSAEETTTQTLDAPTPSIAPTDLVNASRPAASVLPRGDYKTAGVQDTAGDVEPGIKAQVTPRGILLQSNDEELLNKFEQLLKSIAGPNALSSSRMAVFYLKHIGANDAKRMLADFRRGKSPYDSLEDEPEPVSRRRSFRRFSVPSIIADARLNRLIVQGELEDIVKIENHLKIIDRDQSITEVMTRGRPTIIQLEHIRASQAAEVIRQAYAGQVAGGGQASVQKQQQLQQQQLNQLLQNQKKQAQPQPQPSNGGGSGNGGPRQPTRQTQPAPNSRGGQRSQPQEPPEDEQQPQPRRQPSPSPATDSQLTNTREPQMTLAVNEFSNSLIIRAPAPLLEEVEALVRLIDTNATQSTTVISSGAMDPRKIERALRSLLGKRVQTTSSPASPPRPATANPTPPAPQPTPSQPQFRIQTAPGR